MADLTPEALAELEKLAESLFRAFYDAGQHGGPEWATLDDAWRRRWLAAAQTARRELAPAHAALAAELAMLRADLADARARQNERWPRCPDGCGCRMDGEDSDARDCGCDGPCTMECRENGYPDAMSYRDLAVKHAMDQADRYRARAGGHPRRSRRVRRLRCGHAPRTGRTP